MSRGVFDRRVEKLTENISPFFIRIKKSDLGLPDAIEHPPIVVPMGELQSRIYRYIERQYVNFFERRMGRTTPRDVLTRARLIRLLQAATNPDLLRAPLEDFSENAELEGAESLYIDDEEVLSAIRDYALNEVPAKFTTVVNLVHEILAKERGGRILIWCTFVKNLFAIQELLSRQGIESRVLYGGTPTDVEEQEGVIETRERIVREFQSEASAFQVIVANPAAVGESISLHKKCRNALYVERTFNAAAFLQSKDRIHRYGLPPDAEVNYYYILSEDSIDSTVNSRLFEKEAVMMKILETNEIPLISLNMGGWDDQEEVDDIRGVLRDYAKRRS
jgi:hypothetical protein